MAVYTLTKTPEVALFADEVKAIVAANNIGASILVDLFNYLQNPQTGNPEGVKLKYISFAKAWIMPNGELVLFNVATPVVFNPLNAQIKNYSKLEKLYKPAGVIWGFLANDAGVPFELQPQELVMIKPQPRNKLLELYYRLSQAGNSITLNNTATFLLPKRPNVMMDYALGGETLEQSGQQMDKLWKIYYDTVNEEVLVKRMSSIEGTMAFYETEIDGLSFVFDANMRPIIVYIRQGNAWIRWYDTTENRYITKDLGAADRVYISPNHAGTLLVISQRGNKLFLRKQTDSYDTETLLAENIPDTVKLMQTGWTYQDVYQLFFKGG